MIAFILRALRDDPDARSRLPLIDRLEAANSVLIGSRWEQRSGWAVFASEGRAPALIIKADHLPEYKARLQAEHAVLRELNEHSALAGSVPEPVALLTIGNALILAQSGLAGASLSVRARQRLWPSPRVSGREHGRVMEWLTRLHGDVTAAPRSPLNGAAIVARVRQLLPARQRDGGFMRDVSAMARQWPDLRLPLLPGHGDLGASNCLIDRGVVRVFDWEGGRRRRTPLADLIVFLNHYARAQPLAGHRSRKRADAFRAAFLDDGWLARLTQRSYRGQLKRLGLPMEAAEYLLIATLAELGNGTAPISHAARARDYWKPQLRIYASAYPRTALSSRS